MLTKQASRPSTKGVLMERKSLGRGLEQISEIFLSSENNKSKPGRSKTGQSSTKNSQDRSPSKKGQIVSLDQHEQHNRKNNQEKHIHAPYGEFFEEGESVSQKKSSIDPEDLLPGNDMLDAMCEVEEKITVQKKISYPSSPEVQQKMIHLLSRYLEDGYLIRQLQLIRSENNRRPGRCDLKEETITINVEEPPPAAGI
jgi:hypothetical protein